MNQFFSSAKLNPNAGARLRSEILLLPSELLNSSDHTREHSNSQANSPIFTDPSRANFVPRRHFMQHEQPTETGTGSQADSPARTNPERSAAGPSASKSAHSPPACDTRRIEPTETASPLAARGATSPPHSSCGPERATLSDPSGSPALGDREDGTVDSPAPASDSLRRLLLIHLTACHTDPLWLLQV
jgi:hypothetical protein